MSPCDAVRAYDKSGERHIERNDDTVVHRLECKPLFGEAKEITAATRLCIVTT